ncbi:MAG: hypothetical protein LBG44_01950 [Gemmatimonadota bacterium]|jgi:hypothetical protein|nr:hypothetical protein [Gemmatimonadota bacterium]
MKKLLGACFALTLLTACGRKEEVILEEPVLEEVSPAPVVEPAIPVITDSIVIDSAAPAAPATTTP